MPAGEALVEQQCGAGGKCGLHDRAADRPGDRAQKGRPERSVAEDGRIVAQPDEAGAPPMVLASVTLIHTQ